MVANLSTCVHVDSKALVDYLRGKSKDEILAISKVRVNGHVCGRRKPIGVGGSTPFILPRQVTIFSCLGVLKVLEGK